MRHARSAHVKCDCGRRARDEEYNQSIVDNGQGMWPSGSSEVPMRRCTNSCHPEVCRCMNGSSCICSHKPESQEQPQEQPHLDSRASSSVAMDSSDPTEASNRLAFSPGDAMSSSANTPALDTSQYWHNMLTSQPAACADNLQSQHFPEFSGHDFNERLSWMSEPLVQNEDTRLPGSKLWSVESEASPRHDGELLFGSGPPSMPTPLFDLSIESYLQGFEHVMPSSVGENTQDALGNFSNPGLLSSDWERQTQTTAKTTVIDPDLAGPSLLTTTTGAASKAQTQADHVPHPASLSFEPTFDYHISVGSVEANNLTASVKADHRKFSEKGKPLRRY